MFTTRFYDEPGVSFVPLIGDKEYGEDVQVTIDGILSKLDRFTYLVDSYVIIQDCAKDLLGIKAEDGDAMWKVNKYLLNYLNAVFCYHEFIKYYDPPLTKIANQFWFIESKKFWYRFVCEYRDRVVHQSIILKDYSAKDGTPYIDLDEIIRVQKDIIHNEKKERFRDRAQRFLEQIMELYNSPHLVVNGKHYWRIADVVRSAGNEITEMSDKIFSHAYHNDVKPALGRLIEFVQFEDGENKLTYIYDDGSDRSIFEPTAAIEWFFAKMLRSLGSDHVVCKNMIGYFKSKGYTRFYEGYQAISSVMSGDDSSVVSEH